MAIGWLTVLQSVPWSDVISNAPKVAEGAKKLWKMVGRKSVPPESSEVSTQPAGLSEAPTLAVLSDRTAALEAAVADLHDQMLASSELIKALAEQNAQLIGNPPDKPMAPEVEFSKKEVLREEVEIYRQPDHGCLEAC